MRLRFDFDPQKCTACGACAIACMDQNDVDIVGGQLPYRKAFMWEHEMTTDYISVACMHCPDAACVRACPVHCLYQDDETKLILLDSARCIGCHRCQKVCPYGAPTFRATGLARPKERMEKCDGCIDRIHAGLSPACVRCCPTRALTWQWVPDDQPESPVIQLLAQSCVDMASRG